MSRPLASDPALDRRRHRKPVQRRAGCGPPRTGAGSGPVTATGAGRAPAPRGSGIWRGMTPLQAAVVTNSLNLFAHDKDRECVWDHRACLELGRGEVNVVRLGIEGHRLGAHLGRHVGENP